MYILSMDKSMLSKSVFEQSFVKNILMNKNWKIEKYYVKSCDFYNFYKNVNFKYLSKKSNFYNLCSNVFSPSRKRYGITYVKISYFITGTNKRHKTK